MGMWRYFHKCLRLVVLVRNIPHFVAFICGFASHVAVCVHKPPRSDLTSDSVTRADLKERFGFAACC